ncbi:uncharacterized protein LOC125029049 [Penaeus chinensis]|uniref:uncharacterized protein LOC125029049 n=1 Tax=Penaeus chinensis TaxID=139456 RepID=UPI001FB589FD|nr:uncharacterized protein LOC125029049 [Penaeus chinensis]
MRVNTFFGLCLLWLVMLLVCTPATLGAGHTRSEGQIEGFIHGGQDAKRPSTGALLPVTSSHLRPFRPNIYYGPRPTRRRCLYFDRYEYETGPVFRLLPGVPGNAASLYPIYPCRERTWQKNEETIWIRRWCKCKEAEYRCLTERVVIPQTFPTKHLPRTATNQEALSVFRQIWSMYLLVEVLT